MVPSSKKKNLAMTKLSVNTTLARGIGFEMIFSFIYALVFFASTNSRLTFKGFGGPLAIGLFYGVSHVITVKVFGFKFFFFVPHSAFIELFDRGQQLSVAQW